MIELIRLERAGGAHLIIIMIVYMMRKGSTEDVSRVVEFIIDTFSKEIGESAMNIAEQLREKGRQEGRQEGMQAGERTLLLRQLRRRFKILPSAYEKRIEAADAETLLKWGEQVLDAQSLDEIFNQH